MSGVATASAVLLCVRACRSETADAAPPSRFAPVAVEAVAPTAAAPAPPEASAAPADAAPRTAVPPAAAVPPLAVRVEDAETGAPLAGADVYRARRKSPERVRKSQRAGVTGTDGVAALARPFDPEHPAIVVVRAGYEPQGVALPESDAASCTVRLAPAVGIAVVVCVDPAQRPLAGVPVVLSETWDRYDFDALGDPDDDGGFVSVGRTASILRGETDAFGRCRFEGLRLGKWHCVANATGYFVRAEGAAATIARGENELRLELLPLVVWAARRSDDRMLSVQAANPRAPGVFTGTIGHALDPLRIDLWKSSSPGFAEIAPAEDLEKVLSQPRVYDVVFERRGALRIEVVPQLFGRYAGPTEPTLPPPAEEPRAGRVDFVLRDAEGVVRGFDEFYVSANPAVTTSPTDRASRAAFRASPRPGEPWIVAPYGEYRLRPFVLGAGDAIQPVAVVVDRAEVAAEATAPFAVDRVEFAFDWPSYAPAGEATAFVRSEAFDAVPVHFQSGRLRRWIRRSETLHVSLRGPRLNEEETSWRVAELPLVAERTRLRRLPVRLKD